MKKIKRFLASMIMLISIIGISLPHVKAGPRVAVSFQVFYDNLSPYGSWVSSPGYGYVWVPYGAQGFRPYFSNGHWVFTDSGWMWVSFYDWGWAPFHYGSWAYDPFYGWMWVPGYNWAPAWVTWGYYSGYYGWAPIAPGISFSVGYYPPINYWVFAPPRYVTVPGFGGSYYVASNNRIAIDNNTAITSAKSINIVDNTGTYGGKKFSAGPARTEFENAAKTKINPVIVRDHEKPGQAHLSGNAIDIYRPRVSSADKNSAKPSKVVPLESMKRMDGGKSYVESDKMKGRELENKVVPERKPNVKEKQPQMKEQPKRLEQKPEMKSEPKQHERKPEMHQAPKEQPQPKENPKLNGEQEKPKRDVQRQPEHKTKEMASPQQREQVRPQREARPESQTPSGVPRQNYQQQPQQHEQQGKDKPK